MALSSSPPSYAAFLVETTASRRTGVITNENNIDSNPYAYPYFQTKSCLLYELIVKGFDCSSQDKEEESDQKRRLCAKLYKRIKSRCLIRPMETQWMDSCGESALHRLCQIARFSCLLHHNLNLDEEDEEEQFAFHLRQGKIAYNELVTHSIKAILDADYTCASHTNNWGETPLHQFASHCGILTDDPGRSSSGLFSLKVAQLLLQAHPNATSTPNYIHSLPLHEACALSQLVRERQTSMRRTVDFTTSSFSKKGTAWKNQHVQIINLFAQHQPKALFVKNNQNELPLTRAVSSAASSVEVVLTCLCSMEDFFQQRLIPNYYASQQQHPQESNSHEDEKKHQRGEKEEEIRQMVMEGMRQSVMGRKKHKYHSLLDMSAEQQRVVDPASPLGVHWKQMNEITCKVITFSSTEAANNTLQCNPTLVHSDVKQHSLSNINNNNKTHTSFMTISSMIQSMLWKPFCSNHDSSSDNLQQLKSRALRIATQLGDEWCKSLLLLHVAHHGTATATSNALLSNPSQEQKEMQQTYPSNNHPPSIDKTTTTFTSNDYFPTTTTTNPNKLVHAAIALRAPISIITLLSFLNPSCLVLKEERKGKTPLFLAVELGGLKQRHERGLLHCDGKEEKEETTWRNGNATVNTPSHNNNTNNNMFQNNDTLQPSPTNYESFLIHLLTKLSPASAGITDDKGRLPLHIAIESGYKVGLWNDHPTTPFCNYDCGDTTKDHYSIHAEEVERKRRRSKNGVDVGEKEDESDWVLRDIFDAEPRAVSIRDPVTRLYPFMMAAVNPTIIANSTSVVTSSLSSCPNQNGLEKEEKEEEEEEEKEMCIVVNTTFELLRADPSVLRNASYP